MVGQQFVEQKAKCKDIHEPRPKYHWSGGMSRLKHFELPKCLHAIIAVTPTMMSVNYLSKISTLCDEITRVKLAVTSPRRHFCDLAKKTPK